MDGKYKAGDRAPDFTYTTVSERDVEFAGNIERDTFLVFLRYYGCTVCQLEMKKLSDDYAAFSEKANLFVVLQSKPETIIAAGDAAKYPFNLILDPNEELYKLFDIPSMTEKPDPIPPELLEKVKEARALGFTHGEYEGNEMQLPATFLIGADMVIKYAYYGEHAADTPDHAELLALV